MVYLQVQYNFKIMQEIPSYPVDSFGLILLYPLF